MPSKTAAYQAVPPPKPDLVESDDVEELMNAKISGCCLWMPCFGSEPSSSDGSWERIRYSGDHGDPWWNRGWKKIREWSEVWRALSGRPSSAASTRAPPTSAPPNSITTP
ncbi:uncharacterized protein Pyn_00800 [Prunus yedoensis var. nudiflora]|uniref:Uncharacterized protein n=1 Tax=Prunus yedoensis var. nudiflora TaxID=2094558 RepID=A0A314UD96_PRUYE|nr:uncharacterized protein Pyn_00800 [Prunus yedoensis var. nudiflora]